MHVATDAARPRCASRCGGEERRPGVPSILAEWLGCESGRIARSGICQRGRQRVQKSDVLAQACTDRCIIERMSSPVLSRANHASCC